MFLVPQRNQLLRGFADVLLVQCHRDRDRFLVAVAVVLLDRLVGLL